MKGIKVSTSSSSSEEGIQKAADKRRELTRVNINGRGKAEATPRSELYQKLTAKGHPSLGLRRQESRRNSSPMMRRRSAA